LKELYAFEKENGFKQVVQIPLKAIARVIGKAGETINDIADGTVYLFSPAASYVTGDVLVVDGGSWQVSSGVGAKDYPVTLLNAINAPKGGKL